MSKEPQSLDPIARVMQEKFADLYKEYRQARAERRVAHARELELKAKLDALAGAADVFGLQLQRPSSADNDTASAAAVDVVAQAKTADRPPIREIALNQLKRAAPHGVRATAIREYLEREYSTQTHEKTVGMTLYRLLKQGLARREGATWFFVPQNGGKENPGVSPPGSNDVLL